ncbi:MAG TPA: 4-hydroxy-3-methylbut-2-enyl diphosphate reductase, partial [Candidatus Moranbacteria bacterium]|nr:4-hydroxy-3-methylbut-2-enyl diphosphate reductase [Candidatus Moranbacteria bacterium]
MKKKEIVIAPHAGFCFGVKRAMDMTEKCLAEKKEPVYIIGSLVHNDQVMETLKKKGLIKVDSVSDIPEKGTLIIRSHGTTQEVMEAARAKNIKIIDATCPFVGKTKIVAENFYKKGYEVVICGDAKHAEIIGINSWIGNKGKIIGDPKEVDNIKFEKNVIGVLSQTTYKLSFLQDVVGKLLASGKKHIIIENTICSDSTTKQNEIRQLAQEVDVVIVVGGKSSSNTNKLAEISR